MNDTIKKEKKFKRPLLNKIVNVFIVFTILFLFLIFIFLGFSQTSTFRKYLKNQIVTQVSNSINGRLEIERIDGSIFSSIELHNSFLISESDTIISAKLITLKTSPIHLLLKRIFIRDFIIKDAKINIKEIEKDKWNISALNSKDSIRVAEKDTLKEKAPFPFSIQVNNLIFENLNFLRQSYEYLNSNNIYDSLNFNDFKLSNINVEARLFANFPSSIIRFYLNNLSFTPNFTSFKLNQLSAEFEITNEYTKIQNLFFITDSSNIHLNAKVDKLNLLGDLNLFDFKEYPLSVDITAKPFNFNDLSNFISTTNFLRGNIDFNMNAEGYFGNFNVNKLDLDYLSSHLSLVGNIQNLHDPEKLFLDVELTNSHFLEEDAYKLVEGLKIPNYKNVLLHDFNLSFKGEPTRFHATLNGMANESKIFLDTYLDVQKPELDYDITYSVERLNLFPILGSQTSITSNGYIKGYGTNPKTMNSTLEINAWSSKLFDLEIDSLILITTANSKSVVLDLDANLNGSHTALLGTLDLTTTEPNYELNAYINRLDLSRFSNESTDSSNLNISINANGKNIDLDNLTGKLDIIIHPSSIRNKNINETSIELLLSKDDENRRINLLSEIVDLSVSGKFSLYKAANVLEYEVTTISKIINDRVRELNPIENQEPIIFTEKENKNVIPKIANDNLDFDFEFLFKDLSLVALFLNQDQMEISAYGKGNIKNDSSHFYINSEFNIENAFTKKNDNIVFISNLNTALNFNRDHRTESFDNLFGSISLQGEKFYSGLELSNFMGDFIFNQSKLFFNTSLKIENDLSAELEGNAVNIINEPKINLENISLNYKGTYWQNENSAELIFTEDGLKLNKFELFNGISKIYADAIINKDESHQIVFSANNISGLLISKYFFNFGQKPIDANLNLLLSSTGLLSSPNINVDLTIDDIFYDNINFGSIVSFLKYKDYNSLIDLDLFNYNLIENIKVLSIDGSIPMAINYLGENKILDNEPSLIISLSSNNFNIGTFGDLLPLVKNQSGFIFSSLEINGALNNPTMSGYIKLNEGKFRFRENNLDYSFGLKTSFQNKLAIIDSLEISNLSGSRYKGKINGNGFIAIDEFPFSQIDISLKGDLALLGDRTRTMESNLYGDLFIKTDNDLKFTFKDDKYFFGGKIIVDRADLTYSARQQIPAGQNDQIVYEIIEDTNKINFDYKKYQQILQDSELSSKNNETKSLTKFDYKLNIILENIAAAEFIFAPEWNQRLKVETRGELEIIKFGDETRTQGSLELLEGSMLEFFKTFNATGTIKFENDIADPRLQVIATYIGEIENFEQSGKTEEVAVKLRIDSPLSELSKNLSSDKENLSVYIGKSQIENNIPDPRYGAANALTFILLNQLSLELNEEQKTTLGSLGENTAYSLLGAQLTSYLNSSLGGLINSIRIQRYSNRDYYKFLFSGKYNNIRYSFGGNTEYLQLNKADLKVEYMFNPNFLIRLEQKDPVVETASEEKVQELALKYRFRF